MDKEILRQAEPSAVAVLSEIDRWYRVGAAFWIRRITDTDYLSAQVFPVVEAASLCYLHVIHSSAYNSQRVESYRKNTESIPDNVPQDISYIYPVALSLDIDCADEKFLASNELQKIKWLNKLGIWEIDT